MAPGTTGQSARVVKDMKTGPHRRNLILAIAEGVNLFRAKGIAV